MAPTDVAALDEVWVERSTAASPTAPRDARRLLRTEVREHGVVTDLDDVLLVVTELVTNAVVHVGGRVRIRIGRSGEQLYVGVEDTDPSRLPVLVGWGERAEGGRGVRLVEDLAEDWGYAVAPHSKIVWCVFRLGRPPSTPGGGGGGSTS